MINARNLLAALALVPVAAIAAMSDADATKAVQDALAAGQSADSIITMLRDDGRTLDQATTLAMAAAGDVNKAAIAKAGICAAQDSTEAEEVAADLLPGASPSLANIISSLADNYDSGGCDGEEEPIRPPGSYAPSETSNSGGGTEIPGSPSS